MQISAIMNIHELAINRSEKQKQGIQEKNRPSVENDGSLKIEQAEMNDDQSVESTEKEGQQANEDDRTTGRAGNFVDIAI